MLLRGKMCPSAPPVHCQILGGVQKPDEDEGADLDARMSRVRSQRADEHLQRRENGEFSQEGGNWG